MNKKEVKITLNPDGVLQPLIQQMQLCQNVIMFGLRATEEISEFPKATEEEKEIFILNIGEPPKDLIEHKRLFKKWLVKKGFEDLIKGIKLALIEAYFFVNIVDKKNDLKTYGAFVAEVQQLRKTAIEQSLPGLLVKVRPHFKKDLKHLELIESINLARNCLVHADGIITDRHINDKKNESLVIKGLRWKLCYDKDGKEIEVKAGSHVPANTLVKMKQDNFEITFKKGEQLNVTLEQFNNFIKTCYIFGLDLKANLPEIIKLSPTKN